MSLRGTLAVRFPVPLAGARAVSLFVGLASAPSAGAVATPLPAALPITIARPIQDARRGAQDAAANDQYNYIAGLFEKGFHELVVTEARKFLDARGGHARAPLVRYHLGQSLFELAKLAEARGELAKLEPPPADFRYGTEVSFRLAQCALELGPLDEAARRFDAIAASDHYLAPAAAFNAGEAHFRNQAFAAAAKAYAKAVESGDAEYAKSALHGMGWALYEAGEFETAANALQLFVQRHGQDPNAAEAQFLLGECRMKLGKPAEALAAFQKVAPGEWQDDALSAAGFACAQLKDDAKAAQWFLRLEQAVPDSPLLPEARLHAGIHLQGAGRDDDAAGVLDRLLQGDAGAFLPEACYWRGLAERRRSGAKAAVRFFENGLAAKPEKEIEKRLALARADALFDAGDFEKAKEAYAKAGGSSEDAAYSAAVAALNGGDHEGAARHARELLAKFGSGRHGAGANLVLGEALFVQQKWAEALAAFEQAAEAQGEGAEGRAALRPRALSRAGWCAFKLTKLPEAASQFATLVSEFPNDERAAEAAFMAGRAQLRAGNAAAAETALQLVLQQYGKSEWSDDAHYDLAQCKRALGKNDEAERLLAQLAKGGAKVDAGLSQRAALESAEALATAGKHESALQMLAALTNGSGVPVDVLRPALYAQAWSLFSLSQLGEAQRAIEALLGSESASAPMSKEVATPALELAVAIARAQKDGARAQSAYQRLLEIAPGSERAPEVALVAALALDEADDARGAATLLEEANRRWPKWAGRDRLTYQLALDLQKAGDTEKAKQLLAKVVAEMGASPLAAQAAYQLGEQAYAAGDFDGAFARYSQAAGDGSTVADAALYKSGWCRFQQQQFAAAAQLFAGVVARFEKSPLLGEARFLAGESLYRAAQYEPAATALTEFLEKHGKHEQRANGLFRLGLACGELGRMEDCFAALDRLQREFPEFTLKAESDLWLGRALLAKKRTNDALAKFDAVIQGDRGVLAARAHLGRGDTLLVQERIEDALSEFLKVALLFDSEPEVARALLLSGQCLEQLGDPVKAKARYAELLEKHANSPEATPARERLRALAAGSGY